MSEDFSFTTRRAINVPTRFCCSCLVSTAHGVVKSFVSFHTESYREDRYQNHVRAKGYRQYLNGSWSHLKIRIIEVSRVMSWTRRLPWARCNHHGYYGNVYSRTDWPWFLRSLVEMGCQDGGTPKNVLAITCCSQVVCSFSCLLTVSPAVVKLEKVRCEPEMMEKVCVILWTVFVFRSVSSIRTKTAATC